MIVPDPKYRPDFGRSIYVDGTIDASMVSRLTPQIIKLQQESREPITVVINSNGGSVASLVTLKHLLKAPSQDLGEGCRLITVVPTFAASAAADLLSAGDYAVAYPKSNVLYHGTRLSDSELTAERSSYLAQLLRLTLEGTAMDLARDVGFRFFFRFIASRSQFSNIRASLKKPALNDLSCFLEYIRPKLSRTASEILTIAEGRYNRYAEVLDFVSKKLRRIKTSKTELELDGIRLKAIVDFEIKENSSAPGWSLQFQGVHKVTEDFLLYHEYRNVTSSRRFKGWCLAYGRFLVSDDEANQLDSIIDHDEKVEKWTERVRDDIQPIWSFFVALCFTLQRGENDAFTAQDAYWLGLIDEVLGEEECPPVRLIYENKPDPPAALPAAGSES